MRLGQGEGLPGIQCFGYSCKANLDLPQNYEDLLTTAGIDWWRNFQTDILTRYAKFSEGLKLSICREVRVFFNMVARNQPAVAGARSLPELQLRVYWKGWFGSVDEMQN